jgi:hypothetical protein
VAFASVVVEGGRGVVQLCCCGGVVVVGRTSGGSDKRCARKLLCSHQAMHYLIHPTPATNINHYPPTAARASHLERLLQISRLVTLFASATGAAAARAAFIAMHGNER